MVATRSATPFESALTRMGFNDSTRQLFLLHGIVSTSELTTMMPKELDDWAIHSRKSAPAATRDQDPQDGILFPFIAMKSLRAYRAWCIYREACKLPEIVDGFTDALSTSWIHQLTVLSSEKEQADDQTALSKLASFNDWVVWEELFCSAMRKLRNTRTGFALEYLLRPESTVKPTDLSATYDSVDDQICALAVHEKADYKTDNQRLFLILKPLLIEGPGWPFAQPFNKKSSHDGRAAFMALKRQAEGTAAIVARKAASYKLIRDATFTGRAHSYSLDKYIAVHQKAHNELLSLNEPVPETKKVSDFLAGITGDILQTSKEVIAGSPSKHSSFEACQQYLKTVYTARKLTGSQSGNGARSIKRLRQDTKKKGKGKGGKDRAPTQSSMKPGEKLHTGSYSAAEYRLLTSDEKSFIRAKRLEEKGEDGTATRTSSAISRQASSTEEESSGEGEDDEPGPPARKFAKLAVVEDDKEPPKPKKNAGDQFGRKAHKEKKQAEEVPETAEKVPKKAAKAPETAEKLPKKAAKATDKPGKVPEQTDKVPKKAAKATKKVKMTTQE